MLRYLFALYLTLGLLVGVGFLSTAQAQREGCIPAVCENDGTCNCFNEQADRRGCLVQECEEGGPICSCAYISSRGNPYGMHIRLTQCLPTDVFNGEGPENVYADCREGKEIPIITEELQCQRECVVSEECVPVPEVCGDGIDNDCDSLIDCLDTDCDTDPQCINDCPMQGAECGSNVGECSSGAYQCDDSCECICVGAVTPVAEICDGLDNDCDGAIDDGNPEAGGQCGIDVGECQAGTLQCEGGEIACLGSIDPAVEICDDGLDNDCDGLTDEDCNP